MGEAKRKAAARAKFDLTSKPLKTDRFNLFALGAKRSLAKWMSIELSHWSDLKERVIGAVFLDITDQDFGWILMARDKIGRFRCVDVEASLTSEEIAVQRLRGRISVAVEADDFQALGDQEDETNYATDVLTVPAGTKPEQLHPHFRALIEASGRFPSRSVLKEIGPWLAPSDPDFVSEFQFKHFDQRLWEMFLWATFRELGFDVTQPAAPDFTCRAPNAHFTVEATTVNPSTSGVLAKHPDPKTNDEMKDFLAHYMPMKFGSSLTSKLNKKDKDGKSYWERGDARDKPFLVAVADFHITGGAGTPGSMTYTASALWPYLYGHRLDWELTEGELRINPVKLSDHIYQGKSIETGFFDLPGAENISAVIFSNAGTLAKFDRMGIAAGFIPARHKYFRMGVRYNSEPNAVHPLPFIEEIGRADYTERWADELQVFHNPKARLPLAEEIFEGVTQHFFVDGKQKTISPSGVVLASRTLIISTKETGEDRELV